MSKEESVEKFVEKAKKGDLESGLGLADDFKDDVDKMIDKGVEPLEKVSIGKLLKRID